MKDCDRRGCRDLRHEMNRETRTISRICNECGRQVNVIVMTPDQWAAHVVEKSVPMSSLISGFTHKHFTELKRTGICTCVCPECKLPFIDHEVTTYTNGVAECKMK